MTLENSKRCVLCAARRGLRSNLSLFHHIQRLGMSKRATLLSQIFPIRVDDLPPLQVYQVDINGSGESNRVGRRLAYEAYAQDLSGIWTWSAHDRRLITSAHQVGKANLEQFVEACWDKGHDVFRHLHGVNRDSDAHVSAHAKAEFVAFGLWHRVKRSVQRQLRPLSQWIGKVHIERRCRCSPEVVDGHPALRLSVVSEATHQDTLTEYIQQNPDVELDGLAVTDATKKDGLTGTIENVVGPIRDHRSRLLNFPISDGMTQAIKDASDETLVVGVRPFGSPSKQYDYVTDGLNLVIHPKHYQRLNIPTRIQNQFTLAPEDRVAAIGLAVQPLKDEKLVGSAYNSEEAANHIFGTAKTVEYEPRRRLADDTTTRGEEISVEKLQGKGLVEIPPSLESASRTKIGVLVAGVSLQKSTFGKKLKGKLESLGLPDIESSAVSVSKSEPDVRSGVRKLCDGYRPHVLIGILPGPESASGRLYKALKQEANECNLPSQVVLRDTLNVRYAIDNIVFGVVAKLGGVPYLLADPLPYTDYVVGLDIARKHKERTSGTMSVAASTQHFAADGRLRSYYTQETSVEGETLPPDILRSLFPSDDYTGQRVLVHRDGPFRGQEVETLIDLGKEMDASFSLVEVRKQGATRLYEARGSNVSQASKGSHLRLSDLMAHVASTPPPFEQSTPRPLQVCVRSGDLSIEEAIHSVLSFTLMHHGSVRPSRLPVTLHYPDEIAQLHMQGITPPKTTGSNPYWL